MMQSDKQRFLQMLWIQHCLEVSHNVIAALYLAYCLVCDSGIARPEHIIVSRKNIQLQNRESLIYIVPKILQETTHLK